MSAQHASIGSFPRSPERFTAGRHGKREWSACFSLFVQLAVLAGYGPEGKVQQDSEPLDRYEQSSQ